MHQHWGRPDQVRRAQRGVRRANLESPQGVAGAGEVLRDEVEGALDLAVYAGDVAVAAEPGLVADDQPPAIRTVAE